MAGNNSSITYDLLYNGIFSGVPVKVQNKPKIVQGKIDDFHAFLQSLT
jgi:hypothetical protein